jgi:transposase
MKIENINVTEMMAQSRQMLKDNKTIPPDFAALFSILLTVLEILLTRLNKNSTNSSLPPSQDPNRKKLSQRGDTKRKPGGQQGRMGTTLKPVETPDEIIEVPVVKSDLPPGHIYKKVGIAKRQVVEFLISKKIIEYQLEIVEDERGRRFTAQGPEGTSRPIQYGASLKATASYMSIYQLIPYGRVEEYFRDQALIPISVGTLFNINKEAYERWEGFERIALEKLRGSPVLHSDETGINVNGKRIWLHAALNDKWTLFMPHKNRGREAMDEMDILPWFQGISIHDHWLAYFAYDQCSHSLCNAHHLRDLQAAVEASPDHTWAQSMKDTLLEMNLAVQKTEGALSKEEAEVYRKRYRDILKIGALECPQPEVPDKPKKGRKTKKSKELNLLERLRDFEDEALRFMEVASVPFTNNPAENEIRMTKVHQKISGCFKSFEGAQIFCRVRSFLLTSQKHGISATEALSSLFSGKLPEFCLNP